VLGVKRLGQAPQLDAGCGDLLGVLHHLGQGSTQAIQVRDHHDIAGLKAHEQIVQLCLLVTMIQVRPLLHNLLATRLGQRTALRRGFGVFAGTGQDVADQHGTMPAGESGFFVGLLQ